MPNNRPIESVRMMKRTFTGRTVYKNFLETQWCLWGNAATSTLVMPYFVVIARSTSSAVRGRP